LSAGTYTLTIAGADEDLAATGDLDITDTAGRTTIVGATAASTIIDAGWRDGGSSGLGDRVFHVRSGANAEFSQVTIMGGVADGEGGGVYSGDWDYGGGTVTITDSTISGNSATDEGGGLYLSSGMQGTSTATLNNSIVANSSSGGDIAGGGTLSGSHNLIEDGSGGLSGTITGDPLLGPLADNGGPTLTHALLSGSPAIDAGSNDKAAGLTTDQRGYVSRFYGGTVDIGAYEDGATPPPPSLSATVDAGTGEVTVEDIGAGGRDNQLTITIAAGLLVISDVNEQFVSAPAGWTLSADGTSISRPASEFAGALTVNAAGGNDIVTAGTLGQFNALTINGGRATTRSV